MVTEILLAVLSPFVTKLTEDFLDHRRNTVAVTELQDQIVRLLADHRELQMEVVQARMAVVALTRYLVLTHGETFVLHGDRLELARDPQGRRQTILGHVIEDFSSSVEARVGGRQSRPPEPRRPSRPLPPQSARPTSTTESADGSRTASAEALKGFFDDFEEEIMRARLGREIE